MTRDKFVPEGNLLGVIDMDMFIDRIENADAELTNYISHFKGSYEAMTCTDEYQRLDRQQEDARASLADWIVRHRKVIMYAPEWWLTLHGGETLDTLLPKIDAAHEARQHADRVKHIDHLKQCGEYELYLEIYKATKK